MPYARPLLTILIGSTLLSILPMQKAWAQGVSQRAQINAGGQFKRDPARARKNFDQFIIEFSKGDSATAANLRKAFATTDIFELIGQSFAKLGVDTENLFDVMAIVWIGLWQDYNGEIANPSPAVVKAVQTQVAKTASTVPGFAAMTGGEKQDLADGMLLRLALFSAASDALRKQGASGQASIKAGAKQMAQTMLSVDISRFTIDERGITPNEQPAVASARPPQTAPRTLGAAPSLDGTPDISRLKAASLALPSSMKTATIVERDYYNSYNNYSLEVWMLYPSGLAAQCPEADIAKIQLSRAWFKAQKCDVGEWRASPKGPQIRLENETDWDDSFKTTPTAAGTLFEGKLRSSSGGTINGGPEGVSTSVMSDGSFSISREGWIATAMQTSVSSSGSGVFAGGSSPKTQTRANYYINGNIITLGFPDGHIEHRYAIFEVKKGVLEYVHMNGNVYFKD
jgi:hypothetical protein